MAEYTLQNKDIDSLKPGNMTSERAVDAYLSLLSRDNDNVKFVKSKHLNSNTQNSASQFIITPFYISDHWFVAIVDNRAKEYRIYHSGDDSYKNDVEKIAKKITNNFKNYTPVELKNTPRQSNNNDSGLFIMKFCDDFIKYGEYPVKQNFGNRNLPAIRSEIKNSLTKNYRNADNEKSKSSTTPTPGTLIGGKTIARKAQPSIGRKSTSGSVKETLAMKFPSRYGKTNDEPKPRRIVATSRKGRPRITSGTTITPPKPAEEERRIVAATEERPRPRPPPLPPQDPNRRVKVARKGPKPKPSSFSLDFDGEFPPTLPPTLPDNDFDDDLPNFDDNDFDDNLPNFDDVDFGDDQPKRTKSNKKTLRKLKKHRDIKFDRVKDLKLKPSVKANINKFDREKRSVVGDIDDIFNRFNIDQNCEVMILNSTLRLKERRKASLHNAFKDIDFGSDLLKVESDKIIPNPANELEYCTRYGFKKILIGISDFCNQNNIALNGFMIIVVKNGDQLTNYQITFRKGGEIAMIKVFVNVIRNYYKNRDGNFSQIASKYRK